MLSILGLLFQIPTLCIHYYPCNHKALPICNVLKKNNEGCILGLFLQSFLEESTEISSNSYTFGFWPLFPVMELYTLNMAILRNVTFSVIFVQ